MNFTLSKPVVEKRLSIVGDIADAISEAAYKTGVPEENLTAHATLEHDEAEVIKLVIRVYIDPEDMLL